MTVIFDFDGTIADSFESVVKIFEHLTGNKNMTTQDIDELRKTPIREVASKLGVSFWKAPFLLSRGRYLMAAQIKHLHTFPQIPTVIEQLHAEGHELFILTSNSTRNVKSFLKHHHMYKRFVEVRGGVGLFGKAKAIQRLLERNSLEIKDCVYVGDETRDIESAQEIGMRVISVSWGFADRQSLEKHNPTAIADIPEDIVRILEEL
jgi:phosphoglycolate phosphatase